MQDRKVVVIGATGVVGRAAAEELAGLGAEVIGVSRRLLDVPGVQHVPLDLGDADACRATLSSPVFGGTTHVVYAALQESTDLLSGWLDPDLMARNLELFRNALEPIAGAHGSTLEHVNLLQGAKAYGLHLGRSPLPAKERTPRDDHANFYWLQEDALRELADAGGWGWTILRPQVVYGESIGSPMNLLPAIGAYAAMERAAGRPLSFPGGAPSVQEAVDARLLARALGWAATAAEARHEAFNVTNGDVFSWHDVWPAIAETFGMEVGEPQQQRMSEVMPRRADEWAAVVDHHELVAPRELDAFVGSSWIYADVLLSGLSLRPLPALLSTIKIRQAGFGDCIDTEDMFREWFTRFQERRLLPPR